MNFRQATSNLALKMSVCLAVAGACAFLGCSSDYGSAPSNKSAVKEYLDKNAETSQGAKGAKGGKGVLTKSIKQKALNAAPAD